MATRYPVQIYSEICKRISEGEPLRQICRDLHMPNYSTVYNHINDNPEFARRFAHARDIGYDVIADEALEIADTLHIGEETEECGGVLTVKRKDLIKHRKLQVHTRLQLLAKWSPKKYGEKQTIDMNVNDGRAERLARAKAACRPSRNDK
jgi:hypothetical protein